MYTNIKQRLSLVHSTSSSRRRRSVGRVDTRTSTKRRKSFLGGPVYRFTNLPCPDRCGEVGPKEVWGCRG